MSIQLTSQFKENAGLPIEEKMVVATIAVRNAIPAIERFEGLFTYVIDSDGAGNPASYQLQNGILDINWVLYGTGGSGGVISVNDGINTIIDNTSPLNPIINAASTYFQLPGEATAAVFTGIENDYDPAGVMTAPLVSAITVLNIQCTNFSGDAITGLAGGFAGRIMILKNIGTFIFQLINQDAGSIAANRFSFSGMTFRVGSFAVVNLAPGDSIAIRYNITNSRWENVGLNEQDIPDIMERFWVTNNTNQISEDPATGGTVVVTLTQNSLDNTVIGGLQLKNDALAPGNSNYYGTDTAGTKGFFPLPAAGTSGIIQIALATAQGWVSTGGATQGQMYEIIDPPAPFDFGGSFYVMGIKNALNGLSVVSLTGFGFANNFNGNNYYVEGTFDPSMIEFVRMYMPFYNITATISPGLGNNCIAILNDFTSLLITDTTMDDVFITGLSFGNANVIARSILKNISIDFGFFPTSDMDGIICEDGKEVNTGSDASITFFATATIRNSRMGGFSQIVTAGSISNVVMDKFAVIINGVGNSIDSMTIGQGASYTSVASTGVTLENVEMEAFSVLTALSNVIIRSGHIGKYTNVTTNITKFQRFYINMSDNSGMGTLSLDASVSGDIENIHIDWGHSSIVLPAGLSYSSKRLTANGSNFDITLPFVATSINMNGLSWIGLYRMDNTGGGALNLNQILNMQYYFPVKFMPFSSNIGDTIRVVSVAAASAVLSDICLEGGVNVNLVPRNNDENISDYIEIALMNTATGINRQTGGSQLA